MIGREDYEPRRVARIERLRARAAARATEAAAASSRAGEVASMIPFGQPILVGHHSDETRLQLKRNGFRWSPTAGAWQRMPSAWAWSVAREIATMVAGKVARP